MPTPPRKKTIDDLIAIMAALRTPGSGCPWDLEQTFESIAPYTIEEAYEVADAIQRGDREDLKDELGDLLLQVVYHARMAEEESVFDFSDVVDAISAKMVRRHPHVFGDAGAISSSELPGLWDRIKAEEKAARQDGDGERHGALAGVTVGLPALARAVKLQKKASRVGFDWDDPNTVIDKVREEISEIESAMAGSGPGRRDELELEIGDLLFAVANLARHLNIDPDNALRRGNAKFVRRFEGMEMLLEADGRHASDCDLEELEALWQQVKSDET